MLFRVASRRFRILLLAVPLLSCLVACGGSVTGKPPSVVLISIDCLNQRQAATAIDSGWMPAVQRLMRRSRVFTRAYAHAPWTTPSHMSMLTGLYPSQHGYDVPYRFMIEHAGALGRQPGYANLGELLAGAGYQTVAFVGKGVTSEKYGLGQGFELFEEYPKNGRGSDLELTVPRLLEWLESAEPPFFLMFHTYDLHRPRPERLRKMRHALRFIDGQVGTVLDALADRGLFEDSLILLTGDHGSEMRRVEGRCCIHGTGHYEENLKVPLAIKLPRAQAAGGSSRHARHVDLLPTVLEVTGVDYPEYRGPGVSLLGEATSNEGWLSFSEADGRCFQRFGLVSDRYKYIYTPRSTTQGLLRESPLFRDRLCWKPGCGKMPAVEELFDLEADPKERRNLLARARVGETEVAALQRLRRDMERHLNLERFYTRTVQLPDLSAEEAMDPELERSLRALGYIQ